jgi:hypothetical protein
MPSKPYVRLATHSRSPDPPHGRWLTAYFRTREDVWNRLRERANFVFGFSRELERTDGLITSLYGRPLRNPLYTVHLINNRSRGPEHPFQKTTPWETKSRDVGVIVFFPILYQSGTLDTCSEIKLRERMAQCAEV